MPTTGTFCEESRCGIESRNCQTISPSAGNCINKGNNTYSCVCQSMAIGKYCEIDASSCLFNNLKCNGGGICNPPDLTSSVPYCTCDSDHSGSRCQTSNCPESVMVGGHGKCSNQELQFCYAPYSGVRCEIDNCALWNGNVTVNEFNIPDSCLCQTEGWLALYNNQKTASCWPQCPIFNNQMCGSYENQPHSCIQSQSQNTRTAKCQCANGYVLTPNPNNPSESICKKYCDHGTGWFELNELNCI